MHKRNLVLRTVYLDPDLDDRLTAEATATRQPKNDLFRRYLRLGIKIARAAAAQADVSPAAQQQKKSRST